MNRSTEIFREEPIKTKINQLHINEGIVDFTGAVLLNRYKVLHAITNNSGEALLYVAQDLNNKSKYLAKTETCIDNINSVKKITCNKINKKNYVSLLSISDYINTKYL